MLSLFMLILCIQFSVHAHSVWYSVFSSCSVSSFQFILLIDQLRSNTYRHAPILLVILWGICHLKFSIIEDTENATWRLFMLILSFSGYCSQVWKMDCLDPNGMCIQIVDMKNTRSKWSPSKKLSLQEEKLHRGHKNIPPSTIVRE